MYIPFGGDVFSGFPAEAHVKCLIIYLLFVPRFNLHIISLLCEVLIFALQINYSCSPYYTLMVHYILYNHLIINIPSFTDKSYFHGYCRVNIAGFVAII